MREGGARVGSTGDRRSEDYLTKCSLCGETVAQPQSRFMIKYSSC